MHQLTTFLTALWLTTAGSVDVLNLIKKGATKELSAAADPLTKTLVSVGASQCSNVKKIVGVNYDSYEGEEPDLSKLKLMYITEGVTVSYNLSDPESAQRILSSPWFDAGAPWIIFLHGFTDDPSKDSYKNISTAYMSQGACNILALDASSLIRWLYLRSSTMVQFIGEALAKLLAALVGAGVDRMSIHLIGHSLGSHIAGFAGKTFLNLTGTRIGRISSLDPAGPCFGNVTADLRINIDDAEFVFVMHTDAGVYGLNEQIGHVDFYPNSGSLQPNCLFDTCSHSRCWVYFSESVINATAFLAVKCNSWEEFRKGKCNYNDIIIMGHGTPPTARGTYYLQTADEPPFGVSVEGIKYKNNEGIIKNAEYIFS